MAGRVKAAAAPVAAPVAVPAAVRAVRLAVIPGGRDTEDGMDRGLRLVAIDRHRNGCGGNAFHVVLFTWRDADADTGADAAGARRMMATVFEEQGNIAVLDVTETARGNIGFGNGNSWRGDEFEPWLRSQVDAWERRGTASRCATEWAELLGIPASVIMSRLRRGWSDEEALTIPMDLKRSQYLRQVRIAQ